MATKIPAWNIVDNNKMETISSTINLLCKTLNSRNIALIFIREATHTHCLCRGMGCDLTVPKLIYCIHGILLSFSSPPPSCCSPCPFPFNELLKFFLTEKLDTIYDKISIYCYQKNDAITFQSSKKSKLFSFIRSGHVLYIPGILWRKELEKLRKMKNEFHATHTF